MIGPRYATRRDNGHEDIVTALRSIGCSVFDSASIGHGFPDLVVGRESRTFLMEVKTPSPGRREGSELTDDQVTFLANWKGSRVYIVKSVREALEVVAASTEELEAWSRPVPPSGGAGKVVPS